jgi:maltoporin
MNKCQLLPVVSATCFMLASPLALANSIAEQNAADIAELKRQVAEQDEYALQWNGYMRGGFTSNGSSSSGNTTIQAPNAGAFYRLGGGESNYAAWNLNKKIGMNDGAWAKIYSGIVYEDRDARRWVYDTENKTMFMDKIYAEMGGLDFAPEATFWTGRVNYGYDVHIIDRKYYEIRSPGAGVRGLQVGDGTMDLFLTSHDTDGDTKYQDENGNEVDYGDGARPNTHTLGMEYRTGAWWLTASAQVNGNDEKYTYTSSALDEKHVVDPAQTGAHFMAHYTQDDFFGLTDGSVKYIGQYGTGLSAAFLGRHGDTAQVNEGAQNYRMIINGQANFDRWDVNTVMIAQHKKDVDFDGMENSWYSIGARPAYYITNNFALQFEAGYDWSEYKSNTNGESGGMAKFTIAPTLKLDSHTFSRPELRLFATYASFSGDYNASGINGYDSNDDSVLVFGAQVEAWF